MMTVAEFVTALNEYQGDNMWSDLVCDYPNYDPIATAAADPEHMNDVIALVDGTIIDYLEDRHYWRVRP